MTIKLGDTHMVARVTVTAVDQADEIKDADGNRFTPLWAEAHYRPTADGQFELNYLYLRGQAIRADGTTGTRERFRTFGQYGANVGLAPYWLREWAWQHIPARHAGVS